MTDETKETEAAAGFSLVVSQEALEQFLAYRQKAAVLSRELALLEAARTQLRLQVIDDLMQRTNVSRTAATEQSRINPQYVEKGNEVIVKTEEWEKASAAAEYYRLKVEVLNLGLRDVYEKQRQVSELLRMRDLMTARIKELGL